MANTVETSISKCNIHLHFLRRLKRTGYKTAELKLYFTAYVLDLSWNKDASSGQK